MEKLEPHEPITAAQPGDVEVDSDAAVGSESKDCSPETESAEDCADSYAALPVNPTATGSGNAIVGEVIAVSRFLFWGWLPFPARW